MVFLVIGGALALVAGLFFAISYEALVMPKERGDHGVVVEHARRVGQLRHDHAHNRAA